MVFLIGQTQLEAEGQEKTGMHATQVGLPGQKAVRRRVEKGIWKGTWKISSMEHKLTLALLLDREPRGPAVMKPRSRKHHCYCIHCWPDPIQGLTGPETFLLSRVRSQGKDSWCHLYFFSLLNTLDWLLFHEITLFNWSTWQVRENQGQLMLLTHPSSKGLTEAF